MFKFYKWFSLYKRARFLAEKIMSITDFVDETESWLENQKSDANYGRDDKFLLRKILSFEGRRDKLIEIAPQNFKNAQWGSYSSGKSDDYIQKLMKENNRRPAFKEEMRKVFKNI